MKLSGTLSLALGGHQRTMTEGERILRAFDYFYTTEDLTTSSQQTLPNRGVGTGVLTRGANDASSTDDPTALPKTGRRYLWFPGTADNTISIARPAATTHWTATYNDDTTATGTSSADPLILGGTGLSGGVKTIVYRDTDGAGAVVASINFDTDTTSATASTFTATLGGTATIARSTSGLRAWLVPARSGLLVPDGTNDHLQLPAGATPTFTVTTGAYTAIVAGQWATESLTDRRLFSTETADNNGFYLGYATGELLTAKVGDGTAPATRVAPGGAMTNGTTFIGAGIQDGGVLTAWRYGHGQSTSISTTTETNPMTHTTPRVSARADSVVSRSSAPISAVAVAHRALSLDELNAVGAYLSTLAQ